MFKIQLLELLNLPMIIFIGLITSYQDIKYRKIKNKWVLTGIIYSFITLIIVLFYLKFKNLPLNLEYIKIHFLNFLISFGVGFFFWLCRLWTAGDAKLFLTYSALIPLSTYEWGEIGLFPSYILLINTFAPVFLYFLINIILKIKPKIIIKELKNTLNPRLVLAFAVFIFGFNVVTNLVFNLLGIPSNIVVSGIFLLILMIFVYNVLKIDFIKAGLVLSVIRIILEYDSIFSFSFLMMFLYQLAFFLLLRYFVLNLGYHVFSKHIYIEDLKPGMSLAEDIIKKNSKYQKSKEISISFLQSIFDTFEKKKESVLQDQTKLTKKDVELIKKLHSQNEIKEHTILIFEKIHFALFIFLGVLLTIIFRGNFLIFIRNLLEKFL
jgi:Flp pilus assembly protein protease CpaA